jgi:hypothetical protein
VCFFAKKEIYPQYPRDGVQFQELDYFLSRKKYKNHLQKKRDLGDFIENLRVFFCNSQTKAPFGVLGSHQAFMYASVM